MEPGGAWDDRKHQRGRGGAASLPILPQIRSDSFSHRAGTVFWNSASQNVARKCHSGSIGFTISESTQEKLRDLMNGLRIEVPIRTAGIRAWKCLKRLPFYRSATRVSNLAGRQGFSRPVSRNTNKDGLFSRKRRGTSNLGSSSSFVGFRLFASVFVLCQLNDTRNDTRRNRLGGSLRRSPRRTLPSPSSADFARPSATLECPYADSVR
jgi:hypothetical protein